MWPNALDFSAAPFLYGIFPEEVEVFVVPADKQCDKRQVFQPVHAAGILFAAFPYTAEVSFIPNSGQWRLYRKKYYPEIFYIALKMQ